MPRRKNKTTNRANTVSGQVLPFELGQDGVAVQVGRKRFRLPAGVPGDRVRVVPTSGDFARLDQVLEPSPTRTTAPCPLVQRCGGCSLQEMSYRAQLEAKSTELSQVLGSLGSTLELPPVEGLSRPYGFRTKLLMFTGGRPGSLRLGFHRRGSLEIIPAEGCPVQHPLSLAVLASARQIFDAHRIGPSDSPGRGRPSTTGWLHAIGVRVDPQSGESELTLSGRNDRVSDTVAQQLGQIPSVSGVHLAVNPARSSYPMEGTFLTLCGRPRTAFTLSNERYLLSPGAFFQTSAEGAERLQQLVNRLMPERCQRLADLYAGAGLLALSTRARWKKAVVVEANPVAVADLRRHLKRNADSARLSALEGRVEQRIHDVLAHSPDLVLLDPPRRGCAPRVIGALLERPPPVIIYVACGVDALASQARRLVEGGYLLTGAGAVDMFPHTAHLEVVARLEAR